MKKMTFTFMVLSAFLAGCSLEAAKKHSGSFKANGIAYTGGEDQVAASYNNGNANLLDVTIFTGNSQTFGTSIQVNLSQLDATIPIDVNNEVFYYKGDNTSVYYKPINGTWKITSHKEGNPATRHTEGEFEFTAVNPYTPYDTVRVTEGRFYVNNY